MNKKIILIAKNLEQYLSSRLFYSLWFIFEQLKFLFFANKNILSKNRELKNITRKKRAFLLATGPSIKWEDLKKLSGEDCFSVSNFFLHEEIASIDPLLHFFAPYHEPLILENYIDWLKKADQKLPKNTNIVLWHTTKEYVEKHNLFLNRKVYYIYLSPFPSKNKINLLKPTLAPQTWPIMILSSLIYIGYQEIYLLWCDHTVLRDFKKIVTNFYTPTEDIRINAVDGKNWDTSIIEELKSNLNVFIQYKKLNKIAYKKWIKIINLSQDSRLDEFDFDKLEKIIS